MLYYAARAEFRPAVRNSGYSHVVAITFAPTKFCKFWGGKEYKLSYMTKDGEDWITIHGDRANSKLVNWIKREAARRHYQAYIDALKGR